MILKTKTDVFYRNIEVNNDVLNETVSFDTWANYSAWAKGMGLPISKLYDTCRNDKSKYPTSVEGWVVKTYGKNFK